MDALYGKIVGIRFEMGLLADKARVYDNLGSIIRVSFAEIAAIGWMLRQTRKT
jgi:hypothetical protein